MTMRLLLFGGFLGSGKTTLIIRLADALARKQRRVAVVVNEVGEIGIDNQLMRSVGLDVWELSSGCICCSLAGDLLQTLDQLAADHAPEIVIVEASGAADPGKVLAMLPNFHGPVLQSVSTSIVLDPLRLPMLFEVATPLITTQIRNADTLVITKADLGSEEEIEATRRIGAEINPDARIYVLAATESDQWPLEDLIKP